MDSIPVDDNADEEPHCAYLHRNKHNVVYYIGSRTDRAKNGLVEFGNTYLRRIGLKE